MLMGSGYAAAIFFPEERAEAFNRLLRDHLPRAVPRGPSDGPY
jgi:hypothetical protein